MNTPKACLAFVAVSLLATAPISASAAPVKNIVLVHGAWADASGWKGVYDILSKKGFRVVMVQEPETSLADDVAATRRVLDQQDGPTILVGHSYGGSVVTEAGVDPKVVGLVYVAAHAPNVGEDESALGMTMPSILNKISGAVVKSPDGFTHLSPELFVKHFAPDLPHAQAGVHVALAGLRPGGGLRDSARGGGLDDEAELGSHRRRRSGDQSRSRALVLHAGQEPHHRDQGRQPRGIRVASGGGRGGDRGGCPARGESHGQRRTLGARWSTVGGDRRCLGDRRRFQSTVSDLGHAKAVLERI
ncbi:MAG: alpha/beta fold hydrolase [Rhizomicrobium sp.]